MPFVETKINSFEFSKDPATFFFSSLDFFVSGIYLRNPGLLQDHKSVLLPNIFILEFMHTLIDA